MPITITIRLLSGEELTYSARPYQGVVRHATHQERMATLVREHAGVTANTHSVEFVQEDDDELYVQAFRKIFPPGYPANQHMVNGEWISFPPVPAMSEQEILRIRGENTLPWAHLEPQIRDQMKDIRVYTGSTTIHAIVEVREKTLKQQHQESVARIDAWKQWSAEDRAREQQEEQEREAAELAELLLAYP